MRCLVTGGAGFVGSHLCDRLVRDGHQVAALDNFYTGFRRNLEQLDGSPAFEFVEHDVTDPFPAVTGAFDRVYHLACPASPVHYQKEPITTLKTSFLGTLNALEFAEARHARFLQASTSEVYGDPTVSPQSEDYRGNVNPTGPRACYDEGKRVAESLCFDFERHHGTTVRVARIFNTYGPRMAFDDGRVISNFIVQALRGEPLTVYGNGNQTRSFCYVSDLVEGLVRLMENPADSGPVNLGNPNEMTVQDLARFVIDQSGSKSRIVYKDLPVDDPKQRRPDISRAARSLEFQPEVDLRTGIEKTIADFRTRGVT